jgi:hypothetical protein
MSRPITKPLTKIIKPLTKPIENILKPVTGILKPKIPQPQQPIIEAPRGDRNEPTTATTADIKPNDPRLNMSPDQILAERTKFSRVRTADIKPDDPRRRLYAMPEQSLLVDKPLGTPVSGGLKRPRFRGMTVKKLIG